MTAVGAWLLKCDPTRWNLSDYLNDGHRVIGSWTVGHVPRSMSVGDPVLLWVTGPSDPGLWGSGVVTGGAGASGITGHYWHQPPVTPKRWIPVDIRLFDRPVLRAGLKPDPRLGGLSLFVVPNGRTPQIVTPRELATIERYLTRLDVAAYGPTARARAVVINEYRRQGWDVTRVTAPGWDLECRRGAVTWRVLVRRADQPVVDRSALDAANDPQWRLITVDASRTLEVRDGDDILDHAEPATFRING